VGKLKEEGSSMLKRKIAEVQSEWGRYVSEETKRKAMGAFDDVVAVECVLCGELMLRSINAGFKGDNAELEGWKI
jgi:hypothetical protein